MLLVLLCVAAASPYLGGCSAVRQVFGFTGDFALDTYDCLALPGQQVALRAKLQKGCFFSDQPHNVVRFYRDGQLFRCAVTDEEGYACASFTPTQPGNYTFEARVEVEGQCLTESLLIACRDADEPLAIIDIDDTLAATTFHGIMGDCIEPIPGSAEGTRQLAYDFTVLYLTQRPQQYDHRSRQWLARNGYAPGPVFLTEIRHLIVFRAEVKNIWLRDLRKRFTGRAVGVGNQMSDVQAYRANGVEAILLVGSSPGATAGDVLATAAMLQLLPSAVAVVRDWGEVLMAVEDPQDFPAKRVEKQLRRQAQTMPK